MGSRVNLYTEVYNDLIRDRGNTAIWEQSSVCSCVTRDTGQAQFNCDRCFGKGFIYLPGQEITVAVTSLVANINQLNIELREPGTAYITPKSDIIMGYMDRLTFPEFQCKFSEVLHWGEKANYTIQDNTNISPRTYRKIVKVLYLADATYQFEEGVDFKVTEDRYHLEWINKNLDCDGLSMSFLYLTHPSYLVVDVLHELRGHMSDRHTIGDDEKGTGVTYRELPKQYKLQREDFIYNVSEPTAEQSIDEPTDEPTDEQSTSEQVDTEDIEQPVEQV